MQRADIDDNLADADAIQLTVRSNKLLLIGSILPTE